MDICVCALQNSWSFLSKMVWFPSRHFLSNGIYKFKVWQNKNLRLRTLTIPFNVVSISKPVGRGLQRIETNIGRGMGAVGALPEMPVVLIVWNVHKKLDSFFLHQRIMSCSFLPPALISYIIYSKLAQYHRHCSTTSSITPRLGHQFTVTCQNCNNFQISVQVSDYVAYQK